MNHFARWVGVFVAVFLSVGAGAETNRANIIFLLADDVGYGYLCQRIAHTYYPEYLWRNTEKVMFPENADGKRGGVYSHDLMTREALEFVANAKAGRPFFLYLAYTVPHFDLDAPEDSMAQF